MADDTVDEVFRSVKIIDADSHITEPRDLWSSRVSSKMAERVPVLKTVDGHSGWYVDGEPWSSLGGNVIGPGHRREPGTRTLQPYEAIDPGAWSVPDRLELLDEQGIWGQVLYPNGIGFSSNHIFALEDVEQRTLILQIYNDWMMDVQEESNDRLYPQTVLPVWDMDLTIKEMNRLLDRGARGFTLSDKPELLGLPELPEPYWNPMWDLFNESGVAVNFHIGSGMTKEQHEAVRREKHAVHPSSWAYYSKNYPMRRYVVSTSQSSFSNMRIIANLCVSDLFDRFPKLKIVSAESGIGWVPFLLEELDYVFDDIVVSEKEKTYAKRRPVDYYYDHIWTMFFFERSAPERMLDVIGVDHVMVMTDIPHPACVYPGAVARFKQVLAKQPPDIIRKVLQDNAASLYKIPV